MHCMAHARRKFVEALNSDKDRAAYALELFQQLYAIERTIKENKLAYNDLLQLRQKKAVPILQALKEFESEKITFEFSLSTIAAILLYGNSKTIAQILIMPLRVIVDE